MILLRTFLLTTPLNDCKIWNGAISASVIIRTNHLFREEVSGNIHENMILWALLIASKKEGKAMKRSMIAVLILLLCATTAFAANFAPTLLKLSASPTIQYDFDGKAISIPVKVT